MKVYHVTTKRKAELIKVKGLLASHKKNTRIAKKGINYVFGDRYNAGTFASEMQWKSQTPVSVVVANVNKRYLEPDTNPFLHGHSLVTRKDISPRQIEKILPVDDKFWKVHKKLMNKIFKK